MEVGLPSGAVPSVGAVGSLMDRSSNSFAYTLQQQTSLGRSGAPTRPFRLFPCVALDHQAQRQTIRLMRSFPEKFIPLDGTTFR